MKKNCFTCQQHGPFLPTEFTNAWRDLHVAMHDLGEVILMEMAPAFDLILTALSAPVVRRRQLLHKGRKPR